MKNSFQQKEETNCKKGDHSSQYWYDVVMLIGRRRRYESLGREMSDCNL
jgi:hypothetical protein